MECWGEQDSAVCIVATTESFFFNVFQFLNIIQTLFCYSAVVIECF
ncbi:hypothetical protein EcoM_02233 [Escherichia coli WV_060327]|nr:hypothetical protein EcoM_02233 [Escherichia coli WV_060327]